VVPRVSPVAEPYNCNVEPVYPVGRVETRESTVCVWAPTRTSGPPVGGIYRGSRRLVTRNTVPRKSGGVLGIRQSARPQGVRINARSKSARRRRWQFNLMW